MANTAELEKVTGARSTWLAKLKCNNCGNRWFEPIQRGKKIIDTPNGLVIMEDDDDATKTERIPTAEIICYQCNCKSTIVKDIERMNNYRKEKEREREEREREERDEHNGRRDDDFVSATDFNRDRDFNNRDRDFNNRDYRPKKPYYKKY